MKTKYLILALCASFGLLSASCKKEDGGALTNDLLPKVYGPVIVGGTLEFAYAVGATDGSSIRAVEVTASIPGAAGTEIASNGRYTDPAGGSDISVPLVTEKATEGAVSSAFIVDGTVAATLRYYYVVPEEARGKKLTFHFRSQSTTGNASISSPEYTVSSVDIFRGITLNQEGKNCFSLETMEAYTPQEVEAQDIADKIDFIYVHKPTMGSGWTFDHALVAPSNDKGYLYPVDMPHGAGNRTLIEKRYWVDGDLKTTGTATTVYVDELDLRRATFDGNITATYELGTNQGVLVKSADGKYIAYLYINSAATNPGRLGFGAKRLTLN